jgi:hypothetical protein
MGRDVCGKPLANGVVEPYRGGWTSTHDYMVVVVLGLGARRL